MIVEAGYHDATRCTFDGSECWVSWVKVDGKYADTEEHDTEAEARDWCTEQKRARS